MNNSSTRICVITVIAWLMALVNPMWSVEPFSLDAPDEEEVMFMPLPPNCTFLQNAGFEANLSQWSSSGNVNSTTDSYSGTYAANLTGYVASIYQSQTGVTPGNIYTLSAFLKEEGFIWFKTLNLSFFDISGNQIAESYIIVNSSNYQQYQLSAIAPNNAVEVQVEAFKFGSGNFKVDEFCLEETVPVVGDCILVQNESFEDNLDNWFTSNSVGTTSVANTGALAGQLIGNGSRIYHRVGIQAGVTYEFKASAMVTASAPSNARLYIDWRTANNNSISTVIQPVLRNTKQYQEFSLKGKAPANAAYAYIGAYKSGNSSRRLYMDDVCFSIIDDLGGGNYDLVCGCSENLMPNGGFEENFIGSFPYSLEGVPVAAIEDNDDDAFPPFETNISNDYMFFVDDSGDNVNNPEGEHFIYLADDNDRVDFNTHFTNDLKLEDGQNYNLCFYAASWVASLDDDDLPDGGTENQNSGIVYLAFDFNSGKTDVAAWAVPASESFNNLSWDKFTYSFTYDANNPVRSIEIENDRNNIGIAVDAISISKVDCQPQVDCGSNGLNYQRWEGISSSGLEYLLTNAAFPNAPTVTDVLTDYQGPSNFANNYGTRVFGYIVPIFTGNYTFNITGDDDVRLFLSTDSTFWNKSLIASIDGWTQPTQHTKYASQTSSSIYLEAGKKYYTELLQKEGGGGDHFQVYWETPVNNNWNIIPNVNLRPICYPEDCSNGRDDDLDGLIDCADDDCSGFLGNSYLVTDENCGSGEGAIDLTSPSADTPLSFEWSDMPITAQWNFEASTNDVSGNLHHANNVSGSPQYSADAIEGNSSIYFNGSTRIRYSIDGGFMEQSLSAVSISVWLKPENLVGTKTIIDEGGSASCGGRGFAVQLLNDVIWVRARNGSCSGVVTLNDLTFPNDGQWHHVAAVFDNGVLTSYLDGVAGNSATASFTSIGYHGNNGGLGGNFGGSVITSGNRRYRGLMDDVRYYHDFALDAGQVADLFRNDGDRTELFAGTYDVTITTASGCESYESITVNSSNNHTDGGTIFGDEIFCGVSADPGMIGSTQAASGGGTGTNEYQWQSSTDNGTTWNDEAGANSETYDPSTISTTTLFRRAGRLQPCLAWVFSNEVTKSFSENFTDAGAISGIETACNSFDPIIISNDILPSGGSGGATEYQWQESLDSLTWSDIPGANAETLDPTTISQTRWYRRGCRRTPCLDYIFTSTIKKEVVVNYTDGGLIAGEEAECGSYDPGVISSVTEPTGGMGGSLEYQWEYREGYTGAWTSIAGANAETYNPTTIIQTRQYRRGCRRNPCTDYEYSNTITKMVTVNYTSGGIINGDESGCGSYDPGAASNFFPPSGGSDGFQVFQWESSNDGGTTWTEIAGANAAFYDPPTITETMRYRRKSRRAPCPDWIFSNIVIKRVKEIPSPTLLTEPSTVNGFICEFSTYTFEAEDPDDGSTFGWDFGSFGTPSSATGPGPHEVVFDVSNVAAYTSTSVQLTIYKDGCASLTSYDYNVRPQIVVSSVSSVDPTSCGSNDGSITVTTDHPGGTTVEASIDDGVTWLAEPVNFTGLPAGSYGLQVRYVGQECADIWGNVNLADPGNLTADIVISTTETCINEMFQIEAVQVGPGNPTYSWDFGSGATPVIAYGPGPHSVTYNFGALQNIQLTVTENLCTGLVDTTISIAQTYSDGGTLNGDEDLCSAGAGSEMTTKSPPSGGYGGSADYQWEYREEIAPGTWTAWAEISGATAENHTPSFISNTTEYRRKARRLPCLDWAESETVTKRVSGVPQPQDDIYDEGCPGFLFYEYVNSNDLNIINPVYSIETPPLNGTLDLDTDGEFVYTPNNAFCGSDQFTYRVCNNGTTCCATATVTIDLADDQDPFLLNIPEDISIHCDDEVPLPPIVDAWENCQSVTLGLDEASNQGELDSCSIYSYSIFRSWTASDYCGNSAFEQQVINIQDKTSPDIYRIYTLPNGTKMVAGVMENVSHRWKNITFPVQFGSTPVVLAQVVTDNDQTTVTTRLRNISSSFFQMRLQEEENEDDIHSEESVAWIAFEEGTVVDGLPFEVGTKLSSSNSNIISFDQPYSNPGFVGTIQTYNENNPVALRLNTLTNTTAEIFLQEEESFDPETNHGFETVGYVALDDEGDLTNDQSEVIGETGQISFDHNEITVNLNHTYHNPVVVLGGVSTVSSHQALVRVTDVTATTFSVKLEEWEYQNGWHPVENLTYIVVEGSIPFDQDVECSAIPDIPTLGVQIVGLDNCDPSTPITVTDSEFSFDCLADIFYQRTFSVQDECGNTSSYTQTFTLRDTTPPTFTAPADLTITCLSDQHDLTITGDVVDEMDNCADGLEAVYTDNTDNVFGCNGYYLRIWSLTDLCMNVALDTQLIYIFNDNDGDGDGVPDPFDLDDDNDGIPDADEGTGDTDGDGIPDYLDLDSDNDGIPDIIEAGFTDVDGDGRIDTFGQPDWDIDGDGLGNIVDGDPFDPSESASDNFEPFDDGRDIDNDGVPNWLDLDSDNDGIPDLIEAGGADENGDGVIDYPDPSNPESMVDADGDGFFDGFDPDNDDEPGIESPGDVLVTYDGTTYSGGQPSYSPDFDGDGIPDFHDLDSDNDGIPDLIEVGGIDTNGDGQIDNDEFTDIDGNGFHDEYDNNPLIFTDPDGAINDGRAEDDDGDGTVYNDADADSDGWPNHQDIDSDNDNINDIIETGYGVLDVDNDGMIDNWVDGNNDGFNDDSVGQIFTDGEGVNNDGQPEDGIDTGNGTLGGTLPDGAFGQNNGQPDIDDDGDGIPNYLDNDSDNDMLPDDLEDTNGNGTTDEGETGWLDADSDDDLIIDGLEDTNQDGTFQEGIETDPLNPDTDGDSLDDGFEDSNQDGVFDPITESDPKDPCDPLINPACIGVKVSPKVKLKGAMPNAGNSTNTIMRDDLREENLIPTSDPYGPMLSFVHKGDGGDEEVEPSVFNVTGDNAIIDWVFVELREPSDITYVVNTRSALLQADGDVVDLDGISPLFFPSAPSGFYYVTVRHRNHLGTGIQNTQLLHPDPTLIDLTSENTALFGPNGTDVSSQNENILWPGDTDSDGRVIFQGPSNDVFRIFFNVMNDQENTEQLANFISVGYTASDVDMNGRTIFQGPNNDRSMILFFTIMDNPENITLLANYVVNNKLP